MLEESLVLELGLIPHTTEGNLLKKYKVKVKFKDFQKIMGLVKTSSSLKLVSKREVFEEPSDCEKTGVTALFAE